MTKQCRPGQSRRITSLDEAKTLDDGVVVLTSDDGGQVLVVARAEAVQCDEVALLALLADLDELAWPSNNMQGSALSFREAAVGSHIGGGMGGGWVTADVWIHESLVQAGAEEGIRCVFDGRCRRLPPPEPVVTENQRASILHAYMQRLPAYGLDFGWGWPEGWNNDALQRNSTTDGRRDSTPTGRSEVVGSDTAGCRASIRSPSMGTSVCWSR